MMIVNLPQTYLIGLCLLLAIIAILVGRQLYKVRKDEIKLVKLEKEDSNTKPTNKQIKETLLLKGQELEDQLNSLEHVEAQILTLLNQSNPQK